MWIRREIRMKEELKFQLAESRKDGVAHLHIGMLDVQFCCSIHSFSTTRDFFNYILLRYNSQQTNTLQNTTELQKLVSFFQLLDLLISIIQFESD